MVSTMMAVWGELPWKRLPLYIVAQLAGGMLGSTFQYFALPEALRTAQYAAVQVCCSSSIVSCSSVLKLVHR
jgi:glycerol uptake facilitator-like aquaporin